MTRKYLPTLADLVDRLSIVQMKAIFIPEHRDEYMVERRAIEHDIDLILGDLKAQGRELTSKHIHAILVIQLANRFIWENESWIRSGSHQDVPVEVLYAKLRGTHTINGIRNAAKNELSDFDGGRRDYKLDCLAADLPRDFGNWDVFSA
jgi:hypothetical protein